LQRAISHLKTELAKYVGPEQIIRLRADLKGKILVVDPKMGFCGVEYRPRSGRFSKTANFWSAAKASSLPKSSCAVSKKDRCIANVVPGWKLGEVIEGDEVSPAHPAS